MFLWLKHYILQAIIWPILLHNYIDFIDFFEKRLYYFAEKLLKELEFTDREKQSVEINEIIKINKYKYKYSPCDKKDEYDNVYQAIIQSQAKNIEELKPNRLAEIREIVEDRVIELNNGSSKEETKTLNLLSVK